MAEGKMIISIESYGVKHTVELSDECDIFEVINRGITPLLQGVGYHSNSVARGFRDADIIEELIDDEN